jgi:hypothetical protein
MAVSIRKLAPTAVVAAMVSYCCWPHLCGSWRTGKVPEASKLPQIAGSLLSPAIAPAPDRNPFQVHVAEPVVITHDEDPEDAASRGDEPAEWDAAERLVLNGTLVRGDRRFALISGQLYALGEPLRASDSAGSYVIHSIDAGKVVVARPGQTVELQYEGLASTDVPQVNASSPRRNVAPTAASHASEKRTNYASPAKKLTHKTKSNQATP